MTHPVYNSGKKGGIFMLMFIFLIMLFIILLMIPIAFIKVFFFEPW